MEWLFRPFYQPIALTPLSPQGRRMIDARLDTAARVHLTVLSQHEQANTIRRLAANGHGKHTIAQATGSSVEWARRALTEERAT